MLTTLPQKAEPAHTASRLAGVVADVNQACWNRFGP